MEKFTGTQYLKIDVANCYGLDRLTWNDRLHWFDNNEPILEDLESEAKHPILYRKAVIAMRKVQKGEATNHIMGLDATASGLQIMAAISGCHSTAREVNLIDTGKREDIYHNITEHMNSLPNVKVTRELVKKPVMTVFYGSTVQPQEVFGTGPVLNAFYETLKDRLPGAYDLMNIMQSYWSPRATEHSWSLPDGHVARIPVTQMVERCIDVEECENLRFIYRTSIVTNKSKSRSLAANITHSIDGWITRQMVHASKQQGFWMAPIHDCFFASPNHMNQIRENYIKILVWLANSNLLRNIFSDLAGYRVRYYPISRTLAEQIKKAEYPLS